MKAFCIKFQQESKDTTYYVWKIAKDKNQAFKFAFGKSMPRDSSKITTSRGLPIHITQVEEYEVSEAFAVSDIPKKESTEKVSTDGDWLL
jgi:hypothetical protein